MPREYPETPVSNDVVLSELRGLASTVNARFDGVERDQSSMKDWMNRLSTAVERITETTSKLAAVETRIGGMEGEQSDLSLDVEALKERVDKIEKDDVKTNVIRDGLIGGAGAILASGVAFILAHLKVG